MSLSGKKIFRSDINGLRAWAVVLVLLFHFKIPGFSAGFIGVDIFFVISGYLMTGIIFNGLQKNSFSWLHFSIARARRIVPALAVLLTAMAIAGYFWLPPLTLHDLLQQASYAIAFLSNILFWSTAGYFDISAHEKWLLHTWSLGVEMQFYLIYPILLTLCWKLFKKKTKAIIYTLVIFFIASISANFLAYQSQPAAVFYLLPLRSWELIAGGLVYFSERSSLVHESHRKSFFAIGALLITLSIFTIDSGLAWPSPMAVIPVMGTALIILAHKTQSYLFKPRAFQWLGDISYSLYLWHWPLVVLLYYLGLEKQWGWISFAFLTSLILGHTSYHLVEAPTRTLLTRLSLTQQIILITVIATPLVVFINYPHSAPRHDNQAFLSENNDWFNDPCFINEYGEGDQGCAFGGQRIRAYLIGDSHALALRPAFQETLSLRNPDYGFLFWAFSGCPTVKDAIHSPYSKRDPFLCKHYNDELLNFLQTDKKTTPVVLLSRTSLAVIGPNEIDDNPQPFMAFENTDKKEFRKVFKQKLAQTACEIARTRPAYLVRPIPEMGINVPRQLEKNQILGITEDITIPLAEYHKRHATVWEAQDFARQTCGVHILDPTAYLCSQEKCFGSRSGKALYFDGDHLNQAGSSLLIPMFDQIFSSSAK